MPNHVHVLIEVKEHSLSDIVRSWKSYTAHQVNKLLGRTGRFWMPDYFDRFIRDERHFAATVEYIRQNPVKAGLVDAPEKWPWSGWVRGCPVRSESGEGGRDAREPGESRGRVRGSLARVPRVDFLKAHPTLVLDTRHFDHDFVDRLLDSFDDLDGMTDGLLVHGENWQALNLLGEKYRERVKCVYIDPPYNTDASSILYKNDYKHSSWLSLLENRVRVTMRLLQSDGILCSAMDDEEASGARLVFDSLFPKLLGIAVVRSNPQSRKTKGKFSPAHEYALFFGVSSGSVPGSLEITKKRLARYPLEDEKGRFAWMNFIRTGNNDKREDRPKLYYPIFVAQDGNLRVPKMTWSPTAGSYGEYILQESPRADEVVVYPIVEIDGNIIEKNWHRGPGRVSSEPEEFRVRRDKDGKLSIDFKTRMDENSAPTTWWGNNEYASANYGAAELKSLFSDKPFDFPKALSLVADCLRAMNANPGAIILDFFAGSGTTGHAVINLNREDGGRRKFILVEMADYFDTVLLPRIKKVTFSPEWKDGKPKRMATAKEAERGPRILKVIRLESYEDALNNIAFDDPGQQAMQFDDYLLRYMLAWETRHSETLLNVEKLLRPFSYQLHIHRDGETCVQPVDLPETFNYLLGLHVQTRQVYSGRDDREPRHLGTQSSRLPRPQYLVYRGVTRAGRKTAVIWRDTEGWQKEDYERDRQFVAEQKLTEGADEVYVNGDALIPGARALEGLFKARMFAEVEG